MKIAFVCHTSGDAGGEIVMIDSIRALNEKGIKEIYVASPSDGNHGLDRLLTQIQIQSHQKFNYRVARNKFLLFCRNILYGILFGYNKLRRWIDDLAPDIIYINSSVNIIGILAAFKSNRPFIVHIHEQSNKYHKWVPQFTKKFYKRVFNSDNCNVIFVSKYSKNHWEEFLDSEIKCNHIILPPPFMPISDINPRNGSKFCFGFLGSIDKNKNVDTLINAFKDIDEACELIIGGDGEKLQKLKTTEVSSKIHFIGKVTDRQKFYSSINALVVPSYNESWGLVALEAMSCGIPIIITCESGLTDYLTDRINSLIIDPNDIGAIESAMKELMYNRTLYKQLSEKGLALLRQHDFIKSYKTRIYEFISSLK